MYPPGGLYSYGEPYDGYPHRCALCGRIGMA